MEILKKMEETLQWHPAFYAGLQIELQEEADNLIFENEHQLGTKPFGIDVLIIKKESEKPIQKNLGKVFKKYNIIEYKSPDDYLSIDDFYKVYGYCCFYKAEAHGTDSIQINEMTISLVSRKCPRKLLIHLQMERNYRIKQMENGIYFIEGDIIPIQIIVTKDLEINENLWLRSLTNHLEKAEDAEKLIEEYTKNKENNLYKSVMNIIVRANREKFEEVKEMCEALEELMKDELDAKKNEGENRVNELNRLLIEAGRIEDVIKAVENREYQTELLEEFKL